MKKEFTLKRTYEVTATIQIVKRTNGKYYAEILKNLNDVWNENDEYECWIEDDGQLMTEECNTEEEYDAIIETFRSYIEANGIKYARICDKCGNGMNEGYVINGGEEYYCTPKCLHEVYTPKEWQDMYEADDNGNSDNYWTEWEDESTYVLFNNQLIQL
jgi:hypothetical protein